MLAPVVPGGDSLDGEVMSNNGGEGTGTVKSAVNKDALETKKPDDGKPENKDIDDDFSWIPKKPPSPAKETDTPANLGAVGAALSKAVSKSGAPPPLPKAKSASV